MLGIQGIIGKEFKFIGVRAGDKIASWRDCNWNCNSLNISSGSFWLLLGNSDEGSVLKV